MLSLAMIPFTQALALSPSWQAYRNDRPHAVQSQGLISIGKSDSIVTGKPPDVSSILEGPLFAISAVRFLRG
jgi:hypothetical protein